MIPGLHWMHVHSDCFVGHHWSVARDRLLELQDQRDPAIIKEFTRLCDITSCSSYKQNQKPKKRFLFPTRRLEELMSADLLMCWRIVYFYNGNYIISHEILKR